MNILVNMGTNPKEKGNEAYKQLLGQATDELLEDYPQAIIYQPHYGVEALTGKVVIVQDTFSFGTGGHLRKSTRLLVELLMASNRYHITFILLEPNSRHDWVIDKCCSARYESVDSFLNHTDTELDNVRETSKNKGRGCI